MHRSSRSYSEAVRESQKAFIIAALREMNGSAFTVSVPSSSRSSITGPLSHRSAGGTEHLPWLAADISPVGVQAVSAIKQG